MSNFLRTRELPKGAPRSFSQQGQRVRNANKGGFRGPVAGEYDSWWPNTDKALWIAICPNQAWTYELYDRETQKVEKLVDYLFFSYTHHYVPATRRKFVCSAGAHKTSPCWGCGIRNAHFDHLREVQETTGAKPDNKAPISGMLQHVLSIVLLETVAKVPKLDDKGNPRTTRDQKPILSDTPLCMLKPMDQQKYKAKGVTTFGKSMHYSFGPIALGELLAMDEALKNRCATCAADLMCFAATCPECQTEMQACPDEDTPLTGEDLRQFRTADYECSHCKYYGPLLPQVVCECGEPVEGTLTSFALRLKQIEASDKSRKLDLVEIKPLNAFVTKYPVVGEMVSQPLDLPKIFGPSNLNYQVKLIPDRLRGDGVSPEAKRTKGAAPAAESYNFSSDDETASPSTTDDIPY
jgi:hypothetical protein